MANVYHMLLRCTRETVRKFLIEERKSITLSASLSGKLLNRELCLRTTFCLVVTAGAVRDRQHRQRLVSEGIRDER